MSNRSTKNYREGKIPPIQTEYDGFAFCYRLPVLNRDGSMVGHVIFPGYTGDPITFKNCNLTNTIPPDGSILEDCNTTIVEIRKRLEDIRLVDQHEDVIHGRTNPKTLKPEYRMKEGIKEPLRVPVKKRL